MTRGRPKEVNDDGLDPKTLRWAADYLDRSPTPGTRMLRDKASRIEMARPFELYAIQREDDGQWLTVGGEFSSFRTAAEIFADDDEAAEVANKAGWSCRVVTFACRADWGDSDA